MHKKILAAAVAATAASQAMALEVYNDEVNSVSIGGRVGFYVGDHEARDGAGLENDGSRINFKFAHDFQNGWVGSSVIEWGYNPQGDDDLELFNRLGNVSLAHDTYGAFTGGKMYSAYWDVASWTDIFAVVGDASKATSVLYTSHGALGTGRADDAIKYSNSFGGLNVAATYQFEADESLEASTPVSDESFALDREEAYSVSASYDFPFGLSLGAAYNKAEITNKYIGPANIDVKATLGAAKFTSGDFMLATTYGRYENYFYADLFLDKLDAFEFVGEYQLDAVVEGLKLQAGYTLNEGELALTNAEIEEEGYAVAGVLTKGPIEFAVEYSDSTETDIAGREVDSDAVVGSVRYYF